PTSLPCEGPVSEKPDVPARPRLCVADSQATARRRSRQRRQPHGQSRSDALDRGQPAGRSRAYTLRRPAGAHPARPCGPGPDRHGQRHLPGARRTAPHRQAGTDGRRRGRQAARLPARRRGRRHAGRVTVDVGGGTGHEPAMAGPWWWLDELNMALLAITLAASLRWGAAPERLCAAVIVGMQGADAALHAIAGRGAFYHSVDVGHLAIDLLAALAFHHIAVNANRIYPLWLAAFQLISVLAHFARQASDTVAGLAYAYLGYGPFY